MKETSAKPMKRSQPVALQVNGEWHEVSVRPRHMLVEVLRDMIGLTGTKDGCEQGTCGACTVLLNGKPILSCMTLALECDGASIVTIEGLAEGESLTKVQQAFLDQGAVQCGFCTPGMVLTASHLLDHNPKPSVGEIKKALEGNLCRCTGYNAIVDAVLQASDQGVEPVMK
jgi:carbon-monoxide dehydrogenase small subunit